jgi:hypothetical protein
VVGNARRLTRGAVVVVGVMALAWGVRHLNDPVVVTSQHRFPAPQKPQFPVMVMGLWLIYGGTVYLRGK